MSDIGSTWGYDDVVLRSQKAIIKIPLTVAGGYQDLFRTWCVNAAVLHSQRLEDVSLNDVCVVSSEDTFESQTEKSVGCVGVDRCRVRCVNWVLGFDGLQVL